MSSIMLLHQPNPRENKFLCSSIAVTLRQIQQQGRTVELVWVPSHVGVLGNEAADEAANEGLLLPHATIHVAPSLSQLKARTRRSAIAIAAGQHRAEVVRQSTSATWYSIATDMMPPPVPFCMPRCVSTIVHRLRLGFPCWEEISGGNRDCEYCMDLAERPLEHYLLECPATDRLRDIIGYRRQPQRRQTRRQQIDGAIEDTVEAARLVKRLVVSREALDFLKNYPPPR